MVGKYFIYLQLNFKKSHNVMQIIECLLCMLKRSESIELQIVTLQEIYLFTYHPLSLLMELFLIILFSNLTQNNKRNYMN